MVKLSTIKRIRLFRSTGGQICLTIVMTILVMSELKKSTDLDISEDIVDGPPNKVLVLWYPHATLYGLGEGSEGFKNHQCPVSSCTITTDRSQLASADAVLFSATQMVPGELPHHAHNKQVFVFFVFESPLNMATTRTTNVSTFFDLTMTYMDNRETDISVPYGAFLPRNISSDIWIPSDEEIQEKTKPIAWLVSNCRPRSMRKDYAEELSKYIKIDIYGKCGDLTCPKAQRRCFRKLVNEHLFMLAFENSYCDDYITEKLFRSLKSNIVPITYGGANYSKILPPNSYIDVRDYRSPKHLADHLKYLSKNRTAYKEYFRWKADYSLVELEYTRPKALCDLCQILHNDSYQFQHDIDPAVYWDKDRHCMTGEAERRAVHLR